MFETVYHFMFDKPAGWRDIGTVQLVLYTVAAYYGTKLTMRILDELFWRGKVLYTAYWVNRSSNLQLSTPLPPIVLGATPPISTAQQYEFIGQAIARGISQVKDQQDKAAVSG